MKSQNAKTLYALLGLTACGIAYKIYTSKIKKSTQQPMEDDEKAISLLNPDFQVAASNARSLSGLDATDQLMIYGLYKQAKEGNASNANGPSRLNIVASKKYAAWQKFTGMPRHFAMMKYIEVIEHFMSLENDGQQGVSMGYGNEGVLDMMNQDDIDYGDEDDDDSIDFSEDSTDYTDNGGDGINIGGARQSTLVRYNEEENLGVEVETSIFSAASSGDVDRLKSCLESGCDVDERDDCGQTALHLAADQGCLDCVKQLLEAGAFVNAVDNDGISALAAAVIGGDVDVVRALLEAGADPDQEDMDGDTPRTCAEDDDNVELKALLRSAKRLDSVNESFESTASC
ncbi:hypothetical protein CTEN210_15334 [Chaetoceros tenuissimus]|uniref:ACB domain-containing protein n=1 Tax=Chaetoceros tenuissimus TaxID=426638 RepID=A0AAD3D6Y5_9STRA|nr:hypothetical protein CTEN210_15334 [Chaetoceros tenuissimus]